MNQQVVQDQTPVDIQGQPQQFVGQPTMMASQPQQFSQSVYLQPTMPSFAPPMAGSFMSDKQIITQKNQALGQLDKQRKAAAESLNRQYEHQKQLIHFEAERDLQTQLSELEARRQQTMMSIEQENLQYRMQIDQENLMQRLQIEQASTMLSTQSNQQRIAMQQNEKFAKYQQSVGAAAGAGFGLPGTVGNLSHMSSRSLVLPGTVGNLPQTMSFLPQQQQFRGNSIVYTSPQLPQQGLTQQQAGSQQPQTVEAAMTGQ